MADLNEIKKQLTSMKIETRKLEELVPYARNSRTHSDQQINQIAGSIKEFGFTSPVLITKDGEIIAGHGRVLASIRLKLEEVPCIVLGHLTNTQRRAYVIADNQIALNAGWDYELLGLELEDLKEDEFDVSLLALPSFDFDTPPIEQDEDDIESNLDGIISIIKIKCPQELKEEVLEKLKESLAGLAEVEIE